MNNVHHRAAQILASRAGRAFLPTGSRWVTYEHLVACGLAERVTGRRYRATLTTYTAAALAAFTINQR